MVLKEVSLSSTHPVRTGLYARKPHVLLCSEPSTTPDLQIIFNDFPVHPRTVPGSEDGYSVVFSLMTPASRGTVRLASPDPDHSPLIDPNYLSDPSDIARMIAGLRVAREIGGARALTSLRGDELFSGKRSQSAVACHTYLRSTVSSYFHPVGTCKIGSDKMSVVDAQLKVRGIDHLRIADASVMPLLVSGNTNAAVLAIAERAASLLTDD